MDRVGSWELLHLASDGGVHVAEARRALGRHDNVQALRVLKELTRLGLIHERDAGSHQPYVATDAGKNLSKRMAMLVRTDKTLRTFLPPQPPAEEGPELTGGPPP